MTRARRVVRAGIALVMAAVVLTACGSWRGIANVPMPGGPGTGKDTYRIYVQVPDTSALNVNSRVRVADVFVGRVRAIGLKNLIATVTIDVDDDVALPANATATIGQTSLLGSQHVELAAPPDPAPQRLRDGDTIGLQNSTAFPTTERTLASVATVLRGGGIPSLEVISSEVDSMLDGRADQIRQFLDKLDTFTAEVNAQRGDIRSAIDSTRELLSIVAERNDTLDAVLTEMPPLVEHFNETRDLGAEAVQALGELSRLVDEALSQSRQNIDHNLVMLQRPLKQLSRAAPYLAGALRLMVSLPFTIDEVPKLVRGDYANISAVLDLTLSSLDNSLLTGTAFSGALRALEQSWGRDPNTMLPDVRFTPNPADLPPERGE
ncbi:virulence factor Mce family protein [Mycolicibacterium rhodesiae NBB3]|uniref:Virulence factor Mce family protein n=1 Tax=Mycolicibacterium rhodesiae (strain NBB3) TaxID=710685 RepID=G8RPZ9_MYCRN|nr:virulence factor Mce family protein [Mycolicibacterium rhodesiae]AEV73883.1 virulence factor Mce family protein [Mycolicibacterium rhodesiae NBB3]